MATTARTAPAAARSTPWLTALRVTALLSVLAIAWQFVTAGQLFGEDGPEGLHQAGALALHVLSGLTAVAAFLHRRSGRRALWPVVLAVAVFGASFVQAADGGYSSLWAHVPGAMLLTVGAVWVLVWSLGAARADRAG